MKTTLKYFFRIKDKENSHQRLTTAQSKPEPRPSSPQWILLGFRRTLYAVNTLTDFFFEAIR